MSATTLLKSDHATVKKLFAAFAGTMLTRAGKWVASLGVHSSTPRAWTPDEIATIAQVADRVWMAVERAKVEERKITPQELLNTPDPNDDDALAASGSTGAA